MVRPSALSPSTRTMRTVVGVIETPSAISIAPPHDHAMKLLLQSARLSTKLSTNSVVDGRVNSDATPVSPIAYRITQLCEYVFQGAPRRKPQSHHRIRRSIPPSVQVLEHVGRRLCAVAHGSSRIPPA